MTKQEPIAAEHPNVQAALAAAQSEMGPLVKGAVNPHFKSKYADLADVSAVALPSLNRHGIAVSSAFAIIDGRDFWVTTASHGASMTEIQCPVPLIVNGANMQGFKSAVTYAKRIGLESVSGLAPEDDDGNEAAKNPPLAERDRPRPPAPTARDEAAFEADVATVEKVSAARTFGATVCGKIAKSEGPLDAIQVVLDHAAAIARLEAYPAELSNVRAALRDHGVVLSIRDGKATASEADIPADDLPGVREGARNLMAG